ncbi:unnamed protein product [Cyprideis torosa]|uniref:Uncharacterized protein n=1 Tax=Cyprideis torosa TaxID=163714 RepID=A0A7R8WFU2_9CRUS|nr:unnamed protein product [Cyprideis torosa]CAG0891855.1 unnamed protein product [Cyprideis torosa]
MDEPLIRPDGFEDDVGASTKKIYGIKNYAHRFYESLSSPSEQFPRTRLACMSYSSKICMWTGLNLLLVGLTLILIGHLVPPREVLVSGQQNSHYAALDKDAANFNHNLGLCKRIGLIMFCCGGSLLIVTLLWPVLCPPTPMDADYWTDDRFVFDPDCRGESFGRSLKGGCIPSTHKIKSVQPCRGGRR